MSEQNGVNTNKYLKYILDQNEDAPTKGWKKRMSQEDESIPEDLKFAGTGSQENDRDEEIQEGWKEEAS